MTMTTQAMFGLAAFLLAAWPEIYSWLTTGSVRRDAKAPSYQSAIADLASVRLRLVHTGTLSPDAAKAIDVLTLSLVSGSDQ